jgi:hypothetical protein
VNFKNAIVILSLIATGLATGACGSSASSPIGPAQLSNTQTTVTGTGATINGSMTGAALSAIGPSGGTFASLTGPGIMVTVVGTSVTAPVHPNGTFTLTNVPPGDIQLHFTGTGTDALLTVPGVNGGDELRIAVEVSGSTATLKSVSRKDKLNKVEIEGAVVSGTCASFVVNGTTITTDAATSYSKGTCASVVPGALVQVKGATLADGTVRATDVMFKKAEGDDPDGDGEGKNKLQLEGIVTAGACGAFTVKNVAVTTDASTVFKNGRCEEIAIGARVHVKGTSTGPGTALATEVNIQRDADDNGKSGDKGGDDGDADDDDGDGGRGGGNGGGRGKP